MGSGNDNAIVVDCVMVVAVRVIVGDIWDDIVLEIGGGTKVHFDVELYGKEHL